MKLWIALLLIVLLPSVIADGMFVPPSWYNDNIGEPTQKGIIVFNGGQEKLIIEATYNGSLSDFAWIIPVPSYPQVDKANAQLFQELQYLTQPKYLRAPSMFGPVIAKSMMSDGLDQGIKGVDVIEQKQVGIYAISILSADDPQALLDWLNENEYRLPAKAEPILEEYIVKGWYFIAMRINLAPSDEKLLASLKKIDPRVTTLEDAANILAEDIIQAIISEIPYSQLQNVRTVTLEYEPEDPVSGEYPDMYRRSDMPTQLMTQSDYEKAYYQFHGYSEDRMISYIRTTIRNMLNKKYLLPSASSCYAQQNKLEGNYEYCYVWYFTKASPEYNLLKDVDCDSYCAGISPTKEKYTSTDLAQVAANAIVSGNEYIQDYFQVETDSFKWYQNNDDKMRIISNRVKGRLENVREVDKNQVEEQLKDEIVSAYKATLGGTYGNLAELEVFLAQVIINDFNRDAGYYDSQSYVHDILSEGEFNQFKKVYLGDHDTINLEKGIRLQLNATIFWKQNTVAKKLSSGRVQPVIITFQTDEPVYPLRISSVNAGVTEILLYVFSDHKTRVSTLHGFDVEYAKLIETDDIKTYGYYQYLDRVQNSGAAKIAVPPAYVGTYYYLNELIDDEYYLTKFRSEMWPKDMTADLVFEKADNDLPYKKSIYESNFFGKWVLFIFSLLVISGIAFVFMLVPRLLVNRLVKKNKESRWYVSIRRCLAYATAVFVLIVFLVIVPSSFGRVFQDIFTPLAHIVEFFSHVLNAISIPAVLNFILSFAFGFFLSFACMHIVGVGIMTGYRRIKKMISRA
ncbi:MAG: DUF2330 domain-containing protein [Nanoarchaeota archaeon]